MIQTYFDIRNKIDIINEQKPSLINGKTQKILSTAHFVVFNIRVPGKTRVIYLGRGNHWEGVWEHYKSPPSDKKIRDKLLLFIKSNLINFNLKNIEIDSKDRIVILSFYKKNMEKVLMYFYKGRESYFLFVSRIQEKVTIFKSWKGIY